MVSLTGNSELKSRSRFFTCLHY